MFVKGYIYNEIVRDFNFRPLLAHYSSKRHIFLSVIKRHIFLSVILCFLKNIFFKRHIFLSDILCFLKNIFFFPKNIYMFLKKHIDVIEFNRTCI